MAAPTPAPLPSLGEWHWSTHLKHIVIATIIGIVMWLVVFKFSSVWADVTKARHTEAENALKALRALACDAVKEDLARWKRVVEETGLKPE